MVVKENPEGKQTIGFLWKDFPKTMVLLVSIIFRSKTLNIKKHEIPTTSTTQEGN